MLLEAYQPPLEMARFGISRAFLRLTGVSVDKSRDLEAATLQANADYQYFKLRGADRINLIMKQEADNTRTGFLRSLTHGEIFHRAIGVDGRFGPFRFKAIIPFS